MNYDTVKFIVKTFNNTSDPEQRNNFTETLYARIYDNEKVREGCECLRRIWKSFLDVPDVICINSNLKNDNKYIYRISDEDTETHSAVRAWANKILKKYKGKDDEKYASVNAYWSYLKTLEKLKNKANKPQVVNKTPVNNDLAKIQVELNDQKSLDNVKLNI